MITDREPPTGLTARCLRIQSSHLDLAMCFAALLVMVSLSRPVLAELQTDVLTAKPVRQAQASGIVVTETVNGLVAVRHAIVTARCSSIAMARMETDRLGQFTFVSPTAVNCHIEVAKAGFVTQTTSTAVSATIGPPIHFNLKHGAVIEGRILDVDGEPAENVIVVATSAGDAGFSKASALPTPSSVHRTRTDDLGMYRLHSLPAGEYQLEATSEEKTGTRARAFFPGVQTPELARRIPLNVAQEVIGVEFQLLPAK